MAVNFDGLLKKARDKAKNPARFNLGLFMKGDDYKYVLGPEFTALAKEGQPCGRSFLAKCTFKQCKFCHELKANPSKAIIEGMVKRLGEKVEAFIKEEAKKG